MRITQYAPYAMEPYMRVLDLKKLFTADHRYDWESKDFIPLCLELMEKSKDHKFYLTSPSKDKDIENDLSEFAKEHTPDNML